VLQPVLQQKGGILSTRGGIFLGKSAQVEAIVFLIISIILDFNFSVF
jgi:hypothetical protein